MDNSPKEWSAPSVEALTQADGVDKESHVAFRNGLGAPAPPGSPG